ncbi:hypothetical protein F5Y10DRAFT_283959 [Nemania abortiva]|nr:hypothetical protein F5Y10DRAFT_283959 [Nemania abortiva]
MPPHSHRVAEAQDNIWKRNEEVLWRLYLKEHKTLKDVKRIMESEYDFPTTRLPTYASKLHDLGLRKKMKREHWHAVYHHYVKSGYKHSAIYFNGIRIPWAKAWKEIRRSGARECNDCHTTGLPVDVVMRSPSPDLAIQSSISPSVIQIPWGLSDVSLEALSPAAVVHRSKFYEIPSNLLRMNMINISQQSLTRVRMGGDKPSYHRHSLCSPSKLGLEPILLQSLSLAQPGSTRLGISSAIDELSNAFYKLANGDFIWTPPGTPLDESLEVIINKTPNVVLQKLLESDYPTVRTAVKPVLYYLSKLNRVDDFFNVLEAICQFHPKLVNHDAYLQLAGDLGCVKSCRLLLRTWCWPKGDPYSYGYGHTYIDGFLDAIEKGHIENAKIMAEHVCKPITVPPQPENILAYKIFWNFLWAVASGPHSKLRRVASLGLQDPDVLHMLQWFLEGGAKVDLPAGLTRCLDGVGPGLGHHYTRYTPTNWKLTVLDCLYFRNIELYSYIAEHSAQVKTNVTRSGAHRAASEGIESLRTYLLCRPSHTPAEQDNFMDILLTEEFLRAEVDDNIDFVVINTLLDYALDLQKFRFKLSASLMLYYVIKAASRQGMHPKVYHIVKTLKYLGADIVAETIHKAVEAESITLLELLSSYDADFKSQGALALCTALKLGNYEAVNRLLEMGVDVNATLREYGQECGMTILAQANMRMPKRKSQVFGQELNLFGQEVDPFRPKILLVNCELLKYLISRNVKLRANLADPDLRHLLYLVIEHGLRYGNGADTFEKVKVLLDAEPLTNDRQRTEPCLLEACFAGVRGGRLDITVPQRLIFLNYLLDRGISARYSGVLSLLIRYHAPHREIRGLLKRGVDISTFNSEYRDHPRPLPSFTPLAAAARVGSLDLVRLLVQRGADVNQPPKEFRGRTALQAACEGELLDTDEYSINTDVVRFLIDKGADINAPPAPFGGVTALQAAAMRGNFEIVLLLLDQGADINAPPAEEYGYCALDGSATYGKLDMVQFLLNLGALSHDRGQSGYKGAIHLAENDDQSVIADMIRKHALKNGKTGEELFSHHSEWEDAPSEFSGFDEDLDDELGDASDNLDNANDGLGDADEVNDTWFENEYFWQEQLPL